MKNIFLAPRSNETSFQNFESTITGGRTYEFIEPYLDDAEKSILSKHPKISIWGNKESLRSRWEKMKPGDYVLFYAHGSFNYSAQVALTKFSPELARKLWPTENGEPWSCLFFVDNLREIKIPIKVLQELADYEPTWDRVQGFMALRDSGVKAIVSKFGSVEEFLGQKPAVYEALDQVIDSLREEVVDAEVDENYSIPDLSGLFWDAARYTYEGESHKIDTAPHKVRVESKTQKKKIARLEFYACQICNWQLQWKNSKGKHLQRIDVDHIIDKADGGTEEMNNLWVLCPNCHVKKTLGVIRIDMNAKKVFENDKEIQLHHDNHLWSQPFSDKAEE